MIVTPPPSTTGVSSHHSLSDLTTYDDHSNYFSTQNTVRREYGYTAGGEPSGSNVEKYDDINNAWTTKTNLTTAEARVSGFSLNGYGYTAGGTTSPYKATQKYDDIANSWTAKASLNTARYELAEFSLNKYGYTVGGGVGAAGAVTEQYDDVANTWTAKANLNTARYQSTGFSQNGYGYTAGGFNDVSSSEKYDDTANAWTTKASLNTGRENLSGFSLNGYGYTAGGNVAGVSVVTEKYDDIANTWTAKGNLNTARWGLTGFSQNGYGYTAGGDTGAYSKVTEKYDDIANSWTAKTSKTVAQRRLAGFSVGIVPPMLANEVLNSFYHLKNIKTHFDGYNGKSVNTDGSGNASTVAAFNKTFNTTPVVFSNASTQDTTGIYSALNISSGSFTLNIANSSVISGTVTVDVFAFDPIEYV